MILIESHDVMCLSQVLKKRYNYGPVFSEYNFMVFNSFQFTLKWCVDKPRVNQSFLSYTSPPPPFFCCFEEGKLYLLFTESSWESVSNMCELLLLYVRFTNLVLLIFVEVITWTWLPVYVSLPWMSSVSEGIWVVPSLILMKLTYHYYAHKNEVRKTSSPVCC